MNHTQYQSIVGWQVKESQQRLVGKPTVIVSDLSSRLQTRPDSSGDVWYTVKATVANHGDRPIRGVRLLAVDKEGYEIDNVTLTGNIGSGEEKTLSEKTFMPHSQFKRIARWRYIAP